MKLFKKISAIVMAAAMFGMSVMAAEITLDEKVEIASEATEVAFDIKISEGSTIGAYSSFTVVYDSELFTFNSSKSTAGYGAIDLDSTNDREVWWATESLITATAENDVLVHYVFDINEDADVSDATFTIETFDDYMFEDDDMMVNFPFPENATIKVVVEEPAPAEPVPGTVGTKDGYTTVVDDDKATRFVVTDTKASIAATAASVLKVTYAGETKQANLYKLLGVEAGATGDVTIGSLTIKMVLPATVQDAASIGAYSFIVE